MTPQQTSESQETQQDKRADLDRQYRAIGISAVAAAVRYRSDSKNPAYAPVTPHADRRSIDEAA
jgi:hypothetical protein